MAKKTPCPNFEINNEFNWLVYGCIFYQYILCFMVFLSSFVFFYAIMSISPLRLKKSDDAIHNFKWVKIIQIWQNKVSYFQILLINVMFYL